MPLFGPSDIEKLKAEQDIVGLINALGYKEDAEVRRSAAEALEKLGRNPDGSEKV